MQVPSLLHTVLIDLDLLVFTTCLLLTGFAHQVLSKFQTIRPFFPSDATLWNVYTTDTIHTSVLFILHYFTLAPIIFLLELKNLAPAPITARQRRVLALRLAFGMWTATMIAVLIIELGKGYVGRLRPHFATTCLGQPPYPAELLTRVITSEADCLNPDKHALHDARRSFPSGHAALGMGGAAYAQLCFTRFAIRQEGWQSMVSMCAGWLITVFGSWVGASRVWDNAHHVSDVAVGSVVGIWAAGVHFWFVLARNSRAVAAASVVSQQKAE